MITIISKQEDGLIAPIIDPQEIYSCFIILERSKTANDVIQRLTADIDFNIGILCIDKDFDSMYISPNKNKPLFEIYSGGIAVVNMNNPLKIGSECHLEISLIHELGHAMQFLTNRAWYVENEAVALSEKSSDKAKSDAKLEIENDNIKTYELHVCDELGYSHREKYS